jgi:hypothetical protein
MYSNNKHSSLKSKKFGVRCHIPEPLNIIHREEQTSWEAYENKVLHSAPLLSINNTSPLSPTPIFNDRLYRRSVPELPGRIPIPVTGPGSLYHLKDWKVEDYYPSPESLTHENQLSMLFIEPSCIQSKSNSVALQENTLPSSPESLSLQSIDDVLTTCFSDVLQAPPPNPNILSLPSHIKEPIKAKIKQMTSSPKESSWSMRLHWLLYQIQNGETF